MRNRVLGGIRPFRERALWHLAALGALVTAGAAHAEAYPGLVITSTITNSYSYSIAGGPVQSFTAGDYSSVRVGSNVGGYVSELGLDLTGRANGDDFLFLHNAYCVGTCTVNMQTTIVFTLTNTSDLPLTVRFDSLITPGHLAQMNSDGTGNGLFDFQVTQTSYSEYFPGTATMYHAQGSTNGGYAGQIYNDFNGVTRSDQSQDPDHMQAFTVIDWSATNLDFLLATIVPSGGTDVLQYNSTVAINEDALCLQLSTCDGVQVAFGDPRNDGGTHNLESLLRDAAGLPLAIEAGAQPLIGRAYDAYEVPFLAVDKDAPLPPTPPALPRTNYSTLFVSQVPEPASWALMLLGFGALGSVLRRRPIMAETLLR